VHQNKGAQQRGQQKHYYLVANGWWEKSLSCEKTHGKFTSLSCIVTPKRHTANNEFDMRFFFAVGPLKSAQQRF
jgi:hypothetical protein